MKPFRTRGRGPTQGFSAEEMKRVVLTCAECQGKFAPTPYTRRNSERHFCARSCQIQYVKRRSNFTGGGGPYDRSG